MNPVIIYIMGTARSGSTVLDIALGNAPDAVPVGELHKFRTDQPMNWICLGNKRLNRNKQ